MTTTFAYAAQAFGKAHRIRDTRDTATRCGMAVDRDTWSIFPAAEVTDDERCRRCWYQPPAVPVGVTVESVVEDLLVDHVARATQAFAWRCPAHGRFVLARLRMKLERIERTVAEARDVLDRT